MINPVVIKIAVCLLVIKEIWLLLQVPSIENAVISFTTVGAIPGTKHTLTPSQTIAVLLGIFVLACVLIFNRELRRVVGRLFVRQPKLLQDSPTMPLLPPQYERSAAAPGNLRADLPMALLPQSRQGTGRFLAELQSRLNSWWLATRLRMGPILRHIGRLTAKLIQYALRYGLQFWRWLKPHLERFDKWLERKAHENEQMSFMLSVGSEILVTLHSWLEAAKHHPATGKLARK